MSRFCSSISNSLALTHFVKVVSPREKLRRIWSETREDLELPTRSNSALPGQANPADLDIPDSCAAGRVGIASRWAGAGAATSKQTVRDHLPTQLGGWVAAATSSGLTIRPRIRRVAYSDSLAALCFSSRCIVAMYIRLPD